MTTQFETDVVLFPISPQRVANCSLKWFTMNTAVSSKLVLRTRKAYAAMSKVMDNGGLMLD